MLKHFIVNSNVMKSPTLGKAKYEYKKFVTSVKPNIKWDKSM